MSQNLHLTPYTLDHKYLERVYAGVLGKIIGVYLGSHLKGGNTNRFLIN